MKVHFKELVKFSKDCVFIQSLSFLLTSLLEKNGITIWHLITLPSERDCLKKKVIYFLTENHLLRTNSAQIAAMTVPSYNLYKGSTVLILCTYIPLHGVNQR